MLDFIPAALTLANQSLDLATRLRATLKDREAQNQLADLKLQIVELKSHLADALEEKMRMTQDLQTLREKLAGGLKTVSLDTHGSAYRLANGAGPYCTVCFDARHKLILLKRKRLPNRSGTVHVCGECGNHA